MSSYLIRQVRVIDPVSEADRVADVLIEDGVIRAIDDQIADVPDSVEIIDRPNLILAPGLVDLYSHSGEPGFESRETIASLREAATAGGFTRLTILPDTDPALDNSAMVEKVRSLATGFPQLNVWGALTEGVQGKQMTELAELAESGVVGFADGQPIANLSLLRRALEYVQPLNKPIALWCCDRALVGNGVAREGLDSTRFGLPGDPAMSETSAIAAVLECVEAIGTPVHLMRVSTARGVELVRTAKERGLPVTASTTWMHLLLSTAELEGYDPSLHLEPPLGTGADRAALIQGLQTGVLDAIAIDHTPYAYEEKTVAFAESPPGAIGLELALPLLWQAFVDSHLWSALDLWRFLSTNPARCLNQTPSMIAPDQPAEMILFDPQEEWKVLPSTLKSRSTNTPWLGQVITGRVTMMKW